MFVIAFHRLLLQISIVQRTAIYPGPGDGSARRVSGARSEPCANRRFTENIGRRNAVETMMETVRIEHHSLSGGLWFAAWLFTLGYLELGFFKGVLAILLWPYFLGQAFGG
jgi:hypothetical protein